MTFTAGGVMFALPQQKVGHESTIGSVKIDGDREINPRVQVYNFDTEQEFYDWALRQAKNAYQVYQDTINHTRDLAKIYRRSGRIVQGDVLLRIESVRKDYILATVISCENPELRLQAERMIQRRNDPDEHCIGGKYEVLPFNVGNKLKLVLHDSGGVLPAWYETYQKDGVMRPGCVRLRQRGGELFFCDDLLRNRDAA